MRRYLKYIRLIYKKPVLCLRIFKNLILVHGFKKQLLRRVDICLTARCPYDCNKCSSAKLPDPEKQELGLDEIKNIVQQCLKLGAIQLNLTGGEPLLRGDILEIISLLSPRSVFVTINTTGPLLNGDMIRKLKTAGVDMIKMSLDSPVPSEHNGYRNSPGCYEKVIENLALIEKIGGIRSHISTVAIPGNIRSGKIQELLGIIKRFNATMALTIPAPVGRWSHNYNILINAEDRNKLNDLLKHPLVTEDIDTSYKEVKCPAGTEAIYITCYGDVIPCSLLHISFGNIRQENIETIYRRMLNFVPLKTSVPICKAGESKDFIDTWLRPIAEYNRLPVYISDHPSYSKNRGREPGAYNNKTS